VIEVFASFFKKKRFLSRASKQAVLFLKKEPKNVPPRQAMAADQTDSVIFVVAIRMIMVTHPAVVMITVPMVVVIRMRRGHATKGTKRQHNRHDKAACRAEPQHHDTISCYAAWTALLPTDDQDDLQLDVK
jgi:heme/copper-type cytochrome/quinol oxidase subunit 2